MFPRPRRGASCFSCSGCVQGRGRRLSGGRWEGEGQLAISAGMQHIPELLGAGNVPTFILAGAGGQMLVLTRSCPAADPA